MPRTKRKRNKSGLSLKLTCLKEWASEKGLPSKKVLTETVNVSEY